MLLFLIFIIAGLFFVYQYLFAREKFSPAYLLLALWSTAIAISQFRLSPLEFPWPPKFWLLLAVFFGVFTLYYFIIKRFWNKRIKLADLSAIKSNRIFTAAICCLSLLAIAINIYIFMRFGTLPILSTIPDKMRFIINKELFGVWEYIALLPRMLIPMSFIYLILNKQAIKWNEKIILIASILIGFIILSLYASRLTIIITVLLAYFSYLIIKIKEIDFKHIIISSLIAATIVLTVSVAIPVFRQFITYRDYNGGADYNPFSYITNLTQIKLPPALQFITPIYIIPTFNLQALARSMDFYSGKYFYGTFELSVFNSLIKIFHIPEFSATIDWKNMFQPWWVTATFLFSYFIDFGWLGIILAGIFWAALLSAVYSFATRRPSMLSVLLFSYFSFTAVMSIYMNYFQREELYMDLALILIISLIYKKFGQKKDLAS